MLCGRSRWTARGDRSFTPRPLLLGDRSFTPRPLLLFGGPRAAASGPVNCDVSYCTMDGNRHSAVAHRSSATTNNL